MRELHVRVAEDQYEAVESILRDWNLDFTTVDDDENRLVVFAIPTGAVSDMLNDLGEVGIDDDSYTVVTKAEFVETSNFEALHEEYSTNLRKLSKFELHAKIQESQWPYQLYYAGTVLSVLAAAAGLLLDQPALVIGAMVLAPQASSALAAPAGILLENWELFVDSIKEQFLGLAVAVVGAAVFSWFVRAAGFVPPGLSITKIELVGVRLAPTFLSTIGAVIAGIVGAFGYTTEKSTALIGVMIAAALIPAAAAVGLAIAWGAPMFGIGALLLLLVNILGINVGGFVTLLGMGYRPNWLGGDSSFETSLPSDRRSAVYVTLAAILVVTLATGYLTAANAAFARNVNEEVDATLDRPDYRNLSVSNVRTEYGGPGLQAGPTNVTVEVSRTSNRSYPRLATRIERQIERRTGRNVLVTVEFTESRTSDSTASVARSRPVDVLPRG